MKLIVVLFIALGILSGAALFPNRVPAGYRDWQLISVAREEGSLDDIRAILGNPAAIRAYKRDWLPFPEGSIIARIAWSYEPSEENNKAFGLPQSFIAGLPKNGVQFMIKTPENTLRPAAGGTRNSTTADRRRKPS
jgi:hypothetical protein